MKTWIVRFASLYVFNVVVLLLVGWLLPTVSVGWSALWASVILTAATIWLKPVITKAIAAQTRKTASERTATGEKLVQYGAVFIVELIIWILVVVLSRVHVGGFFWGWIVPPILLAIAWIIYDLVDDRIEARAGALYDQAQAGLQGGKAPASAPSAAGSAAAAEGAAELKDGLTPEQRRMLDDLGKS